MAKNVHTPLYSVVYELEREDPPHHPMPQWAKYAEFLLQSGADVATPLGYYKVTPLSYAAKLKSSRSAERQRVGQLLEEAAERQAQRSLDGPPKGPVTTESLLRAAEMGEWVQVQKL